jgi:hypothetical protein
MKIKRSRLIPAALATGAMAVLAATAPTAPTRPAASASANTGSITAGIVADGSATWAGWVGTNEAYEFMDEVNVTFTVPHVNCAGSVGPSTKSKSTPGWHAAFWAGLDGFNPTSKGTNLTVEQDGVIAFCPTKKSTATYRMFWEMFPAGPFFTHQVVKAGDEITVTTSATVPGKTYLFRMWDLSRGTKVASVASCAKHTTCHDAMAEVITEAPGGGPNKNRGLADTGTVHYINAAASYSGLHYGIAFGELPVLWKVTMNPKGLPGIIRPGNLSGAAGPADFSTYWK